MRLNTSFTTYIKLSPVSYKHRSVREHDGVSVSTVDSVLNSTWVVL